MTDGLGSPGHAGLPSVLPSCGDPDETASCPAAIEPAGRPAQCCRPWPGSPRHGGDGPRFRAGADRRWHRGVRQAQRGRQPEGLHRAVRAQPAHPRRSAAKAITPAGWNVNSASLSADGQTVYFLSAKNGSQQLYAQPINGGTPRQLTDFSRRGQLPRVAAGRPRVVQRRRVPGLRLGPGLHREEAEGKKDAKASGQVWDSLFVRHWDTWNDGRRNTLFVAPLPAAKAGAVKGASALSATIDGDAPSKPFGGNDDFAWSPDGASVVASIRGRQAGTVVDQLRSVPLRRRGQAGAGQPDRLQPGLGCRPGVQRRRQDAVLSCDEAPGLRGRPLRPDGDGPGQRQDPRSRRSGTVRRAASPCPPTAPASTPPPTTSASIRCSRSTWPAARPPSWLATAA